MLWNRLRSVPGQVEFAADQEHGAQRQAEGAEGDQWPPVEPGPGQIGGRAVIDEPVA